MLLRKVWHPCKYFFISLCAHFIIAIMLIDTLFFQNQPQALHALSVYTLIQSPSPAAKKTPREKNRRTPLSPHREKSRRAAQKVRAVHFLTPALLSSQKKLNNKRAQRASSLAKKPLSKLIELLHQAIASKEVYPDSALMLQQSGTVTLGFVLFPDGRLLHISILKSSGFSSLDRAARDALMQIAPVKEAYFYLQIERFFSIDIIFR